MFGEGATADESGRSSLLIKNVTVGDAGTYVCAAENAVGTVKALSFVRVTGKRFTHSHLICAIDYCNCNVS